MALKEEIGELWREHRVEKVYQEGFTDAVARVDTKLGIQILAKEIENLRNEKANVQLIAAAVLEREEAVSAVHQLINFVQNNSSNTNAKNEVVAPLHA